MVKTFIAQKIVSIGSIKFDLNADGKVNAFTAICEVSYGTMSRNEVVDLWPLLNSTEKQRVQQVYSAIESKLATEILG